jgi:hypothetical protein
MAVASMEHMSGSSDRGVKERTGERSSGDGRGLQGGGACELRSRAGGRAVAAAARAGGMVAAAEARAEGRAVAAPCLGFFFLLGGG